MGSIRRTITGVSTKLSARITAVLLLISILSGTTYAVGGVVYTSTYMLADNLQYVNTIHYGDGIGRAESFSLLMTGVGDAYPIVMKNDTIYGTFKISTMIRYAEELGKNVLATVNTDFFNTANGVPIGVVIEDGIYKSSPNNRNSVCFGYDGSVNIIEPASVIMKLLNNGGGEEADNTGATMNVVDLNKGRSEVGGLTLYSAAYSTVSTRTSTPGWFVKLKILEGELTVSGSMQLEVTEKITSDGAIPIGEGYLVLSAADKVELGFQYDKFAIGDIIALTTTCDNDILTKARYATGGGDILVINGEKAASENWTPSLKSIAPRTAFGIRDDGTVVSYVVDGRNSSHSQGMTLDELADEMLRQGCVSAVNFDGGGSSALAVRLPGEKTAKVVSKPSDGSERGCATYLLFVTDALSDGVVKNLGLANNGAVLLAESSLELAFNASDTGFVPLDVPGDVVAEAADTNARIDGNTYTAGSIAGPDTIKLYSPSTQAQGLGEIYVITRPTSMTATRKDSGKEITSVILNPGEILEFDINATYFSRTVTAQPHSFEYTVTGDIGEMTAPGVFTTAKAIGRMGAITVTAGGRSIEIKAEISGFEDMTGHWAKQYAELLFSAGITSGVSATRYGPEATMKRCDFVLMLYRAAGEPDVEEIKGFSDVPEEAYYAKAVKWARAAGITEGTDGNNFSPQSPLTRQQAFTLVYRAFDTLDIEYPDGTDEDLLSFEDAPELADYAALPTATLIKHGIVEGSEGRLNPKTSLTRAQMAKILAVALF